MRKNGKIARVLTAMVTPFGPNLEVDYAKVEELVIRLVENGSDGIVVAGTTGESPTLTHEEKLKLFEVVNKTVGDRAVVIAGTGNNSTADSIKLTQEAEAIGVDGVMCVLQQASAGRTLQAFLGDSQVNQPADTCLQHTGTYWMQRTSRDSV